MQGGMGRYTKHGQRELQRAEERGEQPAPLTAQQRGAPRAARLAPPRASQLAHDRGDRRAAPDEEGCEDCEPRQAARRLEA